MAYRSSKHRVTTSDKEVRKKRLKHDKVAKLRAKISKRQDYVCPICERDMRRLTMTLDHCHRTGFIRGVLCNNCNGLEGKLAGIITRIDMKKLGVDKVLENLHEYRDPDNIYHKYVHPNVETLDEQKLRQRKRAALLRKNKKCTQ